MSDSSSESPGSASLGFQSSPSVGDHAFTADSAYGVSTEPMYSGALSFLRRKWTRDASGADIAITGIPYDLATTGRPGARLGPQAIRRASAQLAWNQHYPSGLDFYAGLAVVDTGDMVIDAGRPHLIPDAIQKHTESLLAQGPKLLTLGGDHFISFPILKAHAAKYGPLSLIHFDAHSDTWEDEDGRIDHGTMFRHAAKQNLVVPERSVQIGIRTHNPDPMGFQQFDMVRFLAEGVEGAIAQCLDSAGGHPVYVSFDIDGLDPAFAPGTGTPVAGGLSTREALAILRGLLPLNIIGMDVVEVAPAYDHADITALAGASLASYFLWWHAEKKASK